MWGPYLIWLDPLMGIVGAVLIARWSLGLLRSTSAILLDRQAPEKIQAKVRNSIERDSEDRVADLHIWSIGPSIHAVEITIVSPEPKSPNESRTSRWASR